MTHDGFFLVIFGTRNISEQTQNDGSKTLGGLSMYIEGVGVPNASTSLTISTPTNSQVLSSASWKSMFSADFTNVTLSKTIVSIVQQKSGSSTQCIRIVKKIFILGIDSDPSTRTFTMTIPQSSLAFNMKTIIVLRRCLVPVLPHETTENVAVAAVVLAEVVTVAEPELPSD